MRKLLLCLFLTSSLYQAVQAQRYEKIADVFPTPDLTAEGNKFGTSIAIDRDFAAVSDPIEGAVHVLEYKANQWNRIAKLTYPEASPQYASDGAVAMKDGVIAVAAPHVGSLGTVFVFEKPTGGWADAKANVELTPDTEGETASIFRSFATSVSMTATGILVGSDRSAAYLFQKVGSQWTTMTQSATLSAPDSIDSFDRFGRHVCYLDSMALISADGLNISAGGVYVFRRPSTGWANTASSTLIEANDGDRYDYFGSSIDGFMGHVVIGAPNADRNGAVYVFDGNLDRHSQKAKLTHPDGFYSGIGTSVSTNYSTIVAGVENDRSVYVFEIDPIDYEWKDATPTAVLSAPEGTEATEYIAKLPSSGGTILAGARDLGEGGMVFSYQRTGDDWTDSLPNQEFTATERLSAASDWFGHEVAIDGDYAVVSSPGDDEAGSDVGAAYVFHYNNNSWSKVAKLTLLNPGEYININDVAISGNTIVVGYYQLYSSAAYVYVQPPGGWQDMTETAKLTAAFPYQNHGLGRKVAIEDDVIAIDANGSSYNSVLVYQKPATGWADMTQSAVLTESSAENSPSFGYAIAISKNTIVVGDRGTITLGGAVYVFERSGTTWQDMTQTAKLTVSDAESGDALGEAVDIHNGTIVAGTLKRDFEREAVFVFERPSEGWQDATETARLTPSSSLVRYIGTTVAISDSIIVAGGYNQVLIYYKPIQGWADRVETSAIILDGDFPRAVDISDRTLVLGSSHDYTQDIKAGSAHFYRLKQNNVPVLTQAIADQTATAGNNFSFTITESLFDDSDDDDLTCSATREDGSSLPAWLSFDETTRTFQGQPAKEDIGSIDIKITVSDSYAEVNTTFTMSVQEQTATENNPDDELPDEGGEADDKEEPVVTSEDDKEKETEQQTTEEPVVASEEESVVTSTDDDVTAPDFLLYPNPSSGRFNISGNEPISQITIINGQGQVIFDKGYFDNRNSIVSDALPRGVYQVQIRTKKQIATQRIVVR